MSAKSVQFTVAAHIMAALSYFHGVVVLLTTQSGNHAKEIALCLNSCRWTGIFGIPHDEVCITLWI
jgi:hypothetical protein